MSYRLFSTLGLGRPELVHALRLALAAIAAFAVAATLHVQNAYWAAMPVFVIAQPTRGLVLERGLFRLLGTLAGAAVGLLMLKLSAQPLAMLTLLGLWVGLNAALTQTLRGAHGYAPLLAGMTAAIVILPSIASPEKGAVLAVARAECTLIGVVVATLVIGLVTPASSRSAFYGEIRQSALQVLQATGLILRGQNASSAERRLLVRLAELQDRGAIVTAGSVDGYRRLHRFQTLLVAAMATMSAARTLRRCDTAAASEAATICEALQEAPPATRSGHVDALKGHAPELAAELDELLKAQAFFELEPSAARLSSWRGLGFRLAPHLDVPVAAWTAALAGGATFAAAWAAYRLAWPLAELSALGVCIFSMVLGSLPKPQMVAPIMVRGVVAGVAFALLYRFGVQPFVTTMPGLILSVAPFILVGSLARASGRFGAPALDGNMCFLLASQAGVQVLASPGEIIGGAAALVLAVMMVASAVMALPSPARYRARNAARAIGRDMARIAASSGRAKAGADVRQRGSRQLIRLALHLGQGAELEEGEGGSLVAVLEAGTALTRLQALHEASSIGSSEREAISAALAAVVHVAASPGATADSVLGIAANLPAGKAADCLRDLSAALLDGRKILSAR